MFLKAGIMFFKAEIMFFKAEIMFFKAGTTNNKSRDNDMIKKLLYIIMVALLASCGSDDPSPSPGGKPDEPGGETKPTLLGENLIVMRATGNRTTGSCRSMTAQRA